MYNYNDRPFPEKYTVKDYIFTTKLEKGDHYATTNVKPQGRGDGQTQGNLTF